MTEEYNDDYATCAECYATFIVYHEEIDIGHITHGLEVAPSRFQVKGVCTKNELGVDYVPIIGAWFLSSERKVDSRDIRRHVDWILVQLEGRDAVIKSLQESGHRITIFCYWLSASGHGGPIVSPSIMRRLGELDIEIDFDIYGPYPDDEENDDDDEEDDIYGLFNQDDEDA